ncbi:hypothetical protein TKK_0009919 [Trichogramma kaykai]
MALSPGDLRSQQENKFALLKETEDNQNNGAGNPSTPVAVFKAPPIFVNMVENICPLEELLNEVANKNYTLKIVGDKKVKIQLSSSDKYLPVVEALKNEKTQFYTYQRKDDKGCKVVLRNMHLSVELDDIK